MRQLEKSEEPLRRMRDPGPSSLSETFSVTPKMLERSFGAWLNEIPEPQSQYSTRPLTTEEVIDVSLATVRESVRHRRWPTDVVVRFLAAEIISHPLASHSATVD